MLARRRKIRCDSVRKLLLYFGKSEKLELNIKKETFFYFKNNQEVIDFDINVHNKGNEKQDLYITRTLLNNGGQILDSSGNRFRDESQEVSLKPYEDTTFYYKFEMKEGRRNMQTIDEENYQPFDRFSYKKYTLYMSSEEMLKNTINPITKSQKLDFIKLPTLAKENRYNGNVFPLTVEMNMSNVFGNAIYTNFSFRGIKNFDDGATFIYNGNFYVSSNELYSKGRKTINFHFTWGILQKSMMFN